MKKEYVPCSVSVCRIEELRLKDDLCTDASAVFDDELVIEW